MNPLEPPYIYLFIILAIWELIWKGLALWKSARRKEIYWFIALFIINSAGILPIVYLILRRKKK